MSQQRDSESFYVVKDEATLATLPDWLRRRIYTRWSGTLKDKNGKPLVGLKDGGDHRGIILCLADDLLPRVTEMAKTYCIPAR